MIRAIATFCAVSFAASGGVGASERIDRLLLDIAAAPAGQVREVASRRHVRLSDEATPALLAVVETRGRALAMRERLQAAGLRVEQTADDVALTWVPRDRLRGLADMAGVMRVRRPIPAMWSAVSEGVQLVGANLTQGLGARGQGVRIGVLDSFKGFRAKLGGELPAASAVRFESFVAGGGEGSDDHGVRVAEVLHDVAPDAELFLAAFEDDVGYRNAVDWLLAQGVHIINHSGGFGLLGDLRGNGPLHGKAASAAAANVLYVEAVGNFARSHYHGRFTDDDGDLFHDFAPGVGRMPITVISERKVRVDLSWDDWRPDPSDPRPLVDYDLCIFEANTALVCSRDPQDGGVGQIPFEILEYELPSTGAFTIGVRRAPGARDVDFDILVLPDFDLGALAVSESSFTTVADSSTVFAVGASALSDSLRSYSSRGPTRDGRIKPDILGPDGVATSFGPFFGSSAGCPHVAGAAALLKSLEPGLSASGLAERLRSRAVTLPGDTVSGPDNLYGAGRLDANFRDVPRPSPTPRATPVPSGSSGSGGQSGCRLVTPGGPSGLASELILVAVVLAYAAWLRRHV